MRYMTSGREVTDDAPSPTSLRGNVRQYGMIIALAAIVVLFQFTDRGRAAQADQRVQPGRAERADPDPGHRHGHRHRGPPHRPLGRLRGRLRRRSGRDHDDQVRRAVARSRSCSAWLSEPSIGAWHGFWVAYVGIPAFIVTLASMLLFRGLTLVILEGKTVGGLPENFKKMGNGFLPEIGPDTDLHNLTMVLGVVVVAVLVFLDFRSRAAAKRYNFEVLPFPLFVVKQVVIGAVIMQFCLPARGRPRPADRRPDPLRPDRHLHLHHDPHGLRSPRLRHRRQRRCGHHVRCQHQARRLPRHDQHGPPGRSCRLGDDRSPHRGQPEGRRQLRARRDRGGVHRRRCRHRRRRHGGRRDHRWPGHGCPQQRHVAQRRRGSTGSRRSRAWCCSRPSPSTCGTRSARPAAAEPVRRRPRRPRHLPTSSSRSWSTSSTSRHPRTSNHGDGAAPDTPRHRPPGRTAPSCADTAAAMAAAVFCLFGRVSPGPACWSGCAGGRCRPRRRARSRHCRRRGTPGR